VAADGGKVWVPGTDIPGTGRFAMVSDPGGASYYVFKGLPGDDPPAPPPGTPGRFVWHELYASDPAAAWDFYSRHYGWVKGEGMDMGDMGTYQLFSTLPGADSAGGMMTLPPQMPRPMWLYYVAVEAIDAAAARVTAAGGQVLFGPSEVPGGSWIINALDPQGALFALVAPRR
jgi:predicted enzyme related to lactoylglutathione lyase